MKVRYVLNNYQTGSRFRMTPTHKAVSRKRTDPGHTEVIYQLDSIREKEYVSKLIYGIENKGEIIEDDVQAIE